MNTNCLLKKIANASGKLQPTILTAILNIYNRGLHHITAREVKEECKIIDNSVPWDGRIPAICNAMRNTTECGFSIIGKDINSNDFTISIDDNITNKGLPKENKISKERLPKGKTIYIVSANESSNNLLENLEWGKIQNKSVKKLLIISCSDKKTPGGVNMPGNNSFEDPNLYNNLLIDRGTRNIQYRDFIALNPNYFNKSRSGLGDVNADYFKKQFLAPSYLPAFERYAGKFYNPKLRNLYIEKNQETNLHILIISGLYGVIDFRDSIIDYHLEINKQTFWTKKNNNSILEAIKKYIEINEISNDMVFYSLSTEYKKALNPIFQWKNLWRTGGRSVNLRNSADFLEQEFLPKL